MNHRALAPVVIAASIAFARPVVFVAQEIGRAAEVLAEARKAIGGRALESMKTLSVQAAVQRNVGVMQIASDVEILLELPDKYVRTETMTGGGMIVRGGGTTGFNGDALVRDADSGPPGQGRMFIRIGPGGPVPSGSGEKPTPEQLEQQNHAMLAAAKAEASRFMLGWFAMAHPAANASYSYVGEAESPDGKAYVLEAKNAAGVLARLFVDQSTRLPLMVTYRAPLPRVVTGTAGKGSPEDVAKQLKTMQDQPPEMGDYTIYFEDWRDVDGLKFPFRIRRAVGGTTTEEWSVGKVRLNPKIDPRKFIGDAR